MNGWLRYILLQRHLLWEFLRRDLQARYVGSAMGFFWSVVNPLILLVIYTFVFGLVLGARLEMMGRDKIEDFAFYIFCGLLPWYAFQESLIRSTTCIIDNSHLIKQVRFPAKILPIHLTLSSIVNQLIGTAIFLIALLIFKHTLPVTLVAFPIVIALEIFLFCGLGLLFATLNTYLRDIAPLVTIGTMILMWTTPMFYTLKHAENFLYILKANPLTYLIMIHHDLVLFGEWPSALDWAVLCAISFGSFILGYIRFTRCHQEFADLL